MPVFPKGGLLAKVATCCGGLPLFPKGGPPAEVAACRGGPARRGASACRGGSCSPWGSRGWSAGGWRVLPAEVRRRSRRSSSPWSLNLPRRFVLAVEVRLCAKVQLAAEVRRRRTAAKVTMPWTAHVGVVLRAAACSTCKDEARMPLYSCFHNFRGRLQLSLVAFSAASLGPCGPPQVVSKTSDRPIRALEII